MVLFEKEKDMSQHPGNSSEVARLSEQITREHLAASWALSGLAMGMAQHRFISRRMERIGACQEQLATLVGEQASLEMVMEIMENSPAQKSGPQPRQGR
jgi:hypothetical protein